ncbi:MAG: hypothetical protein ABH881_01610 [bacterium]
MKNKLPLLFSLAVVAFLVSGCITINTGSQDTSAIDGGVFKSINKGTNWVHKSLIPTVTGKPGNFAGVNVYSLEMDPNDSSALYYGSIGSGLLYSYNGAEEWRQSLGLGNSTVRAIAVDPKSKCAIYAGVNNVIYKTVDCGRSWNPIYTDNDNTATMESIIIDHYNSAIIYAGVSRAKKGDVLKSLNGGAGWQSMERAKSPVLKLILDPNDSRAIYAITKLNGVLQSKDGGNVWADFVGLRNAIDENKLGYDIKNLIIDKEKTGVMFAATYQGILKTGNNGETWEKIEILLPEAQAMINALAINPKNSQEIYYVTNTVFYKSFDGGKSWSTSKLPTTRAGWKLLVDPINPNVIYLAPRQITK